MVMRAGSMDLRKLAEVNAGGLPLNKLRKYSSELASVMRCVVFVNTGGGRDTVRDVEDLCT